MLRHMKMKASLVGHEEQLNRVFLVEENMDLNVFAYFVLASFGVEFSHNWQIMVNDRCFLPATMLSEGYGEAAIDYTLIDLTLNRNKEIRLIYDFGEDYVFSIKLVKSFVDFPLVIPFVLLQAKGDTIFEDDHDGLDYFLEHGKFKNGLIPWNIDEGYTLEDYNLPIDIQLINDYVLHRTAELVYGVDDEEQDEEPLMDFDAFTNKNFS